MFFETFAYKNKIQIAFKPHPLLRIKLEQDPTGGVRKQLPIILNGII
jgi:hypothetical protein